MLRYLLFAAFLAAGLSCLCQSDCTDPAASNYNPLAFFDDGSCVYCAADEVAIVVSMTDYFGDGWNGSSYTITDVTGDTVLQSGDLDGAMAGNGTVAGLDAFCLATPCAVLTVQGGQGDTGGITTTISTADGTELVSSAGLFGPYLFSVALPGETCSAGGCTDPTCANYTPYATEDDGSCICFSCPGDFDGDGNRGTPDVLSLLGGFGNDACAWPCNLDLDGNGIIGTGDMLIFNEHFGTTCP